MYDHGFDLPDARHTFFTKDEGKVMVTIVRHWYQPDDDYECEPLFKVSFDITHVGEAGPTVTHLPVGTRQEQAIRIAHELYEEDEEVTEAWNETEAIYAAERRVGA
jgi:hypothetical protein